MPVARTPAMPAFLIIERRSMGKYSSCKRWILAAGRDGRLAEPLAVQLADST
jgi:hypothetical protein